MGKNIYLEKEGTGFLTYDVNVRWQHWILSQVNVTLDRKPANNFY